MTNPKPFSKHPKRNSQNLNKAIILALILALIALCSRGNPPPNQPNQQKNNTQKPTAMNTYNIFHPDHPNTILYHATASNPEQVRDLAEENNLDITGMIIEEERRNIKTELRRDPKPQISDAIIH